MRVIIWLYVAVQKIVAFPALPGLRKHSPNRAIMGGRTHACNAA
ncbi:Uncharacterised protein [Bordetella pertussis]|nr:Uncharacterised protein [Bordetella pertussis]